MERIRLQTPGRAWALFRADIIRLRLPLFLLAGYSLVAELRFGQLCPSRILLGRICPGCGLTRAGLALLRLDFAGAFSWNPAIFLWAPYLFCLLLMRYGFGSAALSPSRRPGVVLLAAICLLTWVSFLLHGNEAAAFS